MEARITGTITKDDAYQVSDPTDWLGTPLASLMQVEQSLRCHVCKDFFNSPVITSCSHTFCSLCIRRSLNTDGKCPLCRAHDQESKLRGNWAIREAAETFVSSRGAMLDLARQPPAVSATPSTTSPKRKAREDPMDDEPATKKIACGDHVTNKRAKRSVSSSAASSRVTRASNAAARIQEEVDETDGEEAEEPAPGDGLVSCPICQWRMKPEKVYTHIDTDCPGQPQPQPNATKPKSFSLGTARSTKVPGASFERLPSVNYSILTDAKLKKRLSDLGISTSGSRLLLEKRHREWVMIWNSNCDSSLPKTKRALLQDLDTWERTQGGMAFTQSLSANRTAQIKDKDFDGAGWSAEHHDSFNDLIARARKSHKKVTETSRDADSPSGGAKGTEQQHAQETDHEHSRNGASTSEVMLGSTPWNGSSLRSSEIIALMSPVKSQGLGRQNVLPSDERSATEADTVIRSTITEDTDMT